MSEKLCLECEVTLPASSFAFQNKKTGKLKPRCRECSATLNAGKWSSSNPYDKAKLQAKADRWRAAGDDRWKLYDGDWFFQKYGELELQDIGSLVGASKQEMTRVAKFHEISSTNTATASVDQAAFVAAHEKGNSYDALSSDFGIPLRSTYRLASNLGLKHAGPVSSGEKEMADFIEGLGLDVIRSDRSLIGPRELDVYVPSKSMAVEFNGVIYHSNLYKEDTYHKERYDSCQNRGVQLIQIWEDDWNFNKETVKATLRAKLGFRSNPPVGARSCAVSIVTEGVANVFMEEHHIQGSRQKTSMCLGLSHEGVLVAVAMFARSGETWTLVRYASSKTVHGGMSKLVGSLIKRVSPALVKTFADHCLSDGKLYERSGWIKDALIPPSYSFVEKGVRHHRFAYQRNRFERDPKLKYDPNLSIKELAALNKIPMIYDAGKTRYVLRP